MEFGQLVKLNKVTLLAAVRNVLLRLGDVQEDTLKVGVNVGVLK